MSWRDFFYFSKGERSGLIVLLCLIVIAGILLILNNRPGSVNDSGLNQTSTANSRESSDKNSDAKQLNTQSLTNKPSSAKESPADKPSTAANSTKQNATSQTTDENRHIEEGGDITSTDTETKPKKESVSERVQRLTAYSHPSYTRTEKFKEGTIVELNTADTTILKKVPGIGSAFAKRIVSYRNLLGGYYSVTQLSEVYGIDEDRYNAFVPWFSADPSLISTLAVNSLPQDSLRRHPYINYGQARVITQLRKQKGRLTGWENLQLLNEFTDNDKIKLQHYLSFE